MQLLADTISNLKAGIREMIFRINESALFDVMPELCVLRFMLSTTEPATGTVDLDDIGIILHSERPAP